MSRADLSLWRIFRVPIFLAMLSLTGLIGALLGDGPWDRLGAGLMAATLLVAIAAWVRRRPSR
ncbi:hypothetical protein [Brevundimonas sp.]|uniref:hypothetical protein n=1 Tax=Brevundimonas sp. TaxID=1871086 RepID=UPI003AF95BA3